MRQQSERQRRDAFEEAEQAERLHGDVLDPVQRIDRDAETESAPDAADGCQGEPVTLRCWTPIRRSAELDHARRHPLPHQAEFSTSQTDCVAPRQGAKEITVADIPYRTALIVGAGAGISASLARGLASAESGSDWPRGKSAGSRCSPRRPGRNASPRVDASDPDAVDRLFADADARFGQPELVVYNASARAPGPLAELDPDAVRRAVEITAFGGFLVIRQAARRMVPRGQGAILLTGATASVKGFASSAAFAMGKFALRGLAQSAARELGPKGIHVAHFVIDGAVRSGRRPDPAEKPDSTLDPDAIAQSYLDVLRQPRSAWSMEIELRPWTERF